ncbi:Crp/Fnr family transcriptional regulator [Flavobacterium sp. J27]|uniref:Crp/Fnr family transcriptional regulator n=1 Tax=Flavobacterium sp. J27 TaxID=2060419 RepID=UPI0010321C9C|nr:Crp/Fnr family transcriptional regulator [Flavobacterium sp. J27]
MKNLETQLQLYFGIAQQEELQNISSFFNHTTLKKGDYLVEYGKKCTTMCFIQSGLLRVFANSENKEVTQWIATPDYFITDLAAFLFETPSRWSIQALVDTDIYIIDKKKYNQINKILPEWNEFERYFLTQCFTMMENRIFSHLSMSAEERYTAFYENNKALFNEVPLQYIASMLGMTPETFSRIRRKYHQ